MYDQALLERFAMRAEQMSQGAKTFGGSISVNAISDALGLSREDGYGIARYLHLIGWAHVEFSGDAPLTLTPKGYEEIAKLRRPNWRRWIDRHPFIMNLFWMTATSIIAGVVYTVITYYLLR